MTEYFKQFATLPPAEVEAALGSSKNRPTLTNLQHAMAYIAKLPLVRHEDNTISTTESLAKWDLADKTLVGIFRLFVTTDRSKLLKGSQIESYNLRYSSLVPLVLSAFKEYKGIMYSEWQWLDPKLKHLVGTKIWELQPYITNPLMVPNVPAEDAVAMVEALNKPPKTIWSPTVPELSKFPRLLKVQILQTWMAYPGLRNKYMILDCNSIDNMPPSIYGGIDDLIEESPFEALVDANATAAEALAKKKPTIADVELPWD